MKAGAQKPPFVLRIVGVKTSALTNVECVGEHGTEARKSGLIDVAPAGGNHEVEIVRTGFEGECGRPIRRLLSEPGIFRNVGYQRRRVVIHPQSVAIKVPAVRRELPEFPVHQGLRGGAQSFYHRAGELHSGVIADPHHEIAHLDTPGAGDGRLIRIRHGKIAPQGLKFG